MFSRISSTIQSAVDVVSPPPLVLDEFVWHWMHITDFYQDNQNASSSKRTPADSPSPPPQMIEDTPIPKHLNEIMRLLLLEDQQCILGEQLNQINTQLTIGPCLERLLRDRCLELLCRLAEQDQPTGAALHVYRFLARLIGDCRVDLLGHGSVLVAVHRLIAMCACAVAGPYERSQIEFLAVVTLRLQANSDLLSCFARDGCPLCSSLLSLLASPDDQVATKAADMLIILVSIADEPVARTIAQQSELPKRLVQRMIDFHAAVPRNLTAREVDHSLAAYSGQTLDLARFSPPMRKLLTFLRWFCYFDTIVQRCRWPELSRWLCAAFAEQFLREQVSPGLFGEVQQEGSQMLLQTVIVIQLLRNSGSSLVHEQICGFACDNGMGQEQLVRRCLAFLDVSTDEAKHELCVQTMQLFEEILARPSRFVVQQLLVDRLLSRNYIDFSLYNISFDLNETAEPGMRLSSEHPTNLLEIDRLSQSVQIDISRFPTIHYFIDLIPDELRSCQQACNGASGLQSYIIEAQKHFDRSLDQCSQWEWPKAAGSSPIGHSAEYFYEGDFINMLFRNLEQMTRLPYEVILQVTSIVSKVALFPHPNLNEYLLNPSLPIRTDAKSLFSVLHSVVDRLQVDVAGIRRLPEKLNQVRHLLLGSIEAEHDVVKAGKQQEFTVDERRILQCLIVIEEFGKELAAIAFVKNQHLI